MDVLEAIQTRRSVNRMTDDAPPRAVLEPGVIADLYDCATDGAWCRIGVRTLKGWLKRDEFWGVYAGETVN